MNTARVTTTMAAITAYTITTMATFNT